MALKANRWLCFFGLIGGFAIGAVAAQAADPPDVQTIVRNSTQTRARLEQESLAWKAIFELPVAGTTLHAANVLSNEIHEITFSVVQGGKSQQIAAISMRDGVWYVTQQGKMAKYRPYEAPLFMPSLYLFLDRADRFFVEEQTLEAAQFESFEGNIATYRTPLPETARRQLQFAVTMFEKAKQAAPERDHSKSAAQVAAIREILETGVACQVDVDSGIMVENGQPGRRMWVRDIRWSPLKPPAPLSTALKNAEDKTSSLLESAASLEDLIVIGHAAGWAPGQPSIDTEIVLLNLRNGELRRVPYPMAGTGPSCFSKDRRSVFTTGVVGEEGVLGLFQIDLTTGETRRLGENALGGITMFPTLSPDGRTLAVLTKTGQENEGLGSQVCLVEVESGRVTKVGKPLDTAFMSWLPDQSGLILITRKSRGGSLPSEEKIARMDLDGRITPIRKGSCPIVLGSEERILFEDDDEQWKTCDFTGNNTRIIGDGLAGYGFPALSPDFKRLIMMRFAKETGPRPYVVEIESGKATPVIAEDGLWVFPAWR